MGGHGGLNILPQKSWNVYNYENREKVRRDEEAAAKEEQLKQEQSRKRDAEFRLETLRQARGIHVQRPQSPSLSPDPNSISNSNSNSKHINLFEGLKTFPFSCRPEDDVQEDGPKKQKRQRRNDAPAAAAPKVVLPEDDKYRLGYGVAGKGVKAPWYLSRPLASEDGNGGSATAPQQAENSRKASGKKTLEELREERMKREKQEKERERALFSGRKKRDRASARLR